MFIALKISNDALSNISVLRRKSCSGKKTYVMFLHRNKHVQEAEGAWMQEGTQELLHVQGQEGQPVRRYPSSKDRSSSCALLEQP